MINKKKEVKFKNYINCLKIKSLTKTANNSGTTKYKLDLKTKYFYSCLYLV